MICMRPTSIFHKTVTDTCQNDENNQLFDSCLMQSAMVFQVIGMLNCHLILKYVVISIVKTTIKTSFDPTPTFTHGS